MAQQQTGLDPGGKQHLKYPYSVGGSAVPKTTAADDHLRDLILQVLFTNPGERVNLPDFGAGVQQLLFEPSSDTLRASAEFLISTNVQRWLGDRIDVEKVSVTTITGEENIVTIEITYTSKATQQRGSVTVRM